MLGETGARPETYCFKKEEVILKNRTILKN